jgi:outer membrane protein OmpA-like peptidoglycan-associated protein
LEIGYINKSAQLLHKGGYALTPDGTKMYFTWKKYGGVGQYDIWEAKFDGTTWVSARNIGMPVNSKDDDYCPTISADGKTFMFLRATGVPEKKAKPGKLMTCQLIGKNTWTNPTVAKGFEGKLVYAPRLLADGKTIVYTMDKGGVLKFFKSVKTGSKWSEPISLAFLDGQGLDPYVSGSIHTSMLYTSIKGEHSHDLYKVKFPDNLKPDPITFIEGNVQDIVNNKPIKSFVQVYDVKNWERLFVQKTDEKGNFNLILPSGTVYDIYIQESSLKHTFYSESIDLMKMNKFNRKTIHAKVKRLNPGIGFVMEGVTFKPSSTKLEPYSLKELERLQSLLKANSSLNLEIAVFNQNYQSDSIKSSLDLTELIVDTIVTQKEVIDSVLIVQEPDTVMEDSVAVVKIPEPKYTFTKRMVEVKTLKKTYHNDRTKKQAIVVYKYLLKKGISKYRMSYKGYGKDVHTLHLEHKDAKHLEKGVMVIFQ